MGLFLAGEPGRRLRLALAAKIWGGGGGAEWQPPVPVL